MIVYILGGGPTGLALVHGLLEAENIPFVVLEREATVGGLAQTVCWATHGYHDLGPHKIFTIDKDLMSRVLALLSRDGWLRRSKHSSIYLREHFLPYPPSPFSLIGIYGLLGFTGMVLDYGIARVRSLLNSKTPHSFQEDLVSRIGQKLYKAMFEPIAFKLWGDPTKLDVKLSKGRIQTPSLKELIGRILKIRAESNFEALEFWYPKGGLQKIWDAIIKKTYHQGKYFFNQEVTAIIAENNTINTIRYKDRLTGKEGEIAVDKNDFVFSTLPLYKLLEIMEKAISANIKIDLIKKVIKLNDLILVFLKIDKPSLIDDSWVFVPDPKVIFHRLSEQESFDPDMTPGGSIVCCEIMSNEIRPLRQLSDEELIVAAKKGLDAMGYKGFSVLDQKVIRLPASYPVFQVGFEPLLEKILDELDRLVNFRTIGRQGAFNYIGTLDAMDIGYGAARWLINHRSAPDAVDAWKEERLRTRHYPVLD